jgi:Outer membrane protein beta-barrel domain
MSLKLNSLLTAILLSTTTLSVFAQSDAIKQSAVGIKGGFNASNLYTDEVDDQNLLPGFHVGVFVKAAVTEYIAFQPELLFSTKGAKLKYNNDFFEGEATFSLSYIELPILLKLNLTKNINVHAGPYIATLAAVKINNESSADFFDFEDELDKDDFETLDYGLVAGVGLDFDRLSLGLRYDYGLMKVGKERTFFGQSYRVPDASNSTIQIYAGINLF